MMNDNLEVSVNQDISRVAQSFELENEDPNISSTLSNYFGNESSLDIDTVIVYIEGKSLNSIGNDELRLDILTNVHLVEFHAALSYSDQLTNLVKKAEISSIRIDYSDNFHFIYPLLVEKYSHRTNFISITTKSRSKLGYWELIIPQITKKIDNLFNY